MNQQDNDIENAEIQRAVSQSELIEPLDPGYQLDLGNQRNSNPVDLRGEALMHSFRRNPFYAKRGDGSVVNVRVVTNKKYDFFVTGFFNGGSNSYFGSFGGFNFLESDGLKFVSPQIIHVFGESKEGVSSDSTKFRFVIFDYPYTASRKDVLPAENRIINQVLHSIDSIRDKKTLDKHNDSFGIFYISEGFETAKIFTRSNVVRDNRLVSQDAASPTYTTNG